MSIYFEKNHQRSFGTFPLRGEICKQAILSAAQIGFRAFDTAQMYGNEIETGAALKATGIAREDFCLTTKVDFKNFNKDFLPSVEQSLRDLQTDYVDVLLLHWPPADGDIRPSLEMLQTAYDTGYARNIGVSNYTVAMLQTATRSVDAPLVTNQVEFHPLLNQDVLRAGAADLGVPLSAYCSVARGAVFKRPMFAEIGATYGKTAAQVVLRWILQKGVSVNVMSTNPDNIAANYDIMDFSLSPTDMARIDTLGAENYRIVNKELAPFAPNFD